MRRMCKAPSGGIARPRTVLSSSIAIVIGPTPPGTGVRKPGELGGAGLDVADEPVVGAVDADVDHGRALPSPSGAARSPARRRRRRARRPREVSAARSRVREWQIVTVACRCRSSSAAGLPTMSLRPITTAFAPSSSTPYSSSSSSTPSGVPGTSAGRAGEQQARVHRMEAVDVLHRIDGADHARLVDPVRAAAAGRGCRRRRRRRSARRRARAAPPRSSSPAGAGRAPRSRPRSTPCASAGCRCPTRGRRRRAPSPARSAARAPRPRAATSARMRAASALPSMSVAAISSPRITATAVVASCDRAHRPTTPTHRAPSGALARDRCLAPGRTARHRRHRGNRGAEGRGRQRLGPRPSSASSPPLEPETEPSTRPACPYPLHELLTYLVDRHGLLLHGSNHTTLETLEPQPARDLDTALLAVVACDDGIWPMFYAVVARDRVEGVLTACTHIGRGSRRRRFYLFAVVGAPRRTRRSPTASSTHFRVPAFAANGETNG